MSLFTSSIILNSKANFKQCHNSPASRPGRRRADVCIHSRQLQLLLSARPWRQTLSSVRAAGQTGCGWITSTSPQPPRCQRLGKDELVYGRRSCGQRRRWTDNRPVVRRVPCGNNNNVTVVYGASFFRAYKLPIHFIRYKFLLGELHLCTMQVPWYHTILCI